VARLILDAGPHEAVAYANGNRLDLRRSNLSTRLRRGGKRKTWVTTAIDLHPCCQEAQIAFLKQRNRKEAK
jgi:hypothetical protein